MLTDSGRPSWVGLAAPALARVLFETAAQDHAQTGRCVRGQAAEVGFALENLGGDSSYYGLYNEIMRIRPDPFPPSWKAIVRRTIETHSSDSENFHEGNADLFYSVSGIGSGEWGLRLARG